MPAWANLVGPVRENHLNHPEAVFMGGVCAIPRAALRRALTPCAVYLALFEASQYTTSARFETKTRPTVN